MKNKPRFALRPFFCLLCLLFSGALVSADTPVKMDVASPFARTANPLSLQVKLARWFPVAITLSNTGEPLKGRLTLNLTSTIGDDNRDMHTMSVYSDVELPTTALKRIWLYARSDSEDWDGATVTFAARGIKTLESSFNLQTRDPGSRIILTVSNADEKLAYLNGFDDKRLAVASEIAGADEFNLPGSPNAKSAGGRQGWLRPLGATQDLVPDRWVGLEAADMVVLHDFPHSALTPQQVAAIQGYVAGGGSLLVLGGPDWQRLAQSPLGSLWPVQPEASGAASAAETREAVERYLPNGAPSGADKLGGSPAVLARGTLRSGAKKLVGQGATTLLAERNWGAGRVIWSAMDPTKPPFVGWRGQQNLWVELIKLSAAPRRLESVALSDPRNWSQYDGNGGNRQDATGRMVQVIQNLPQLRMPSTSVIAWFLALYVFILVPVNYFVLRMIDKREWAWVTVPVIAIVFSVASYLAARSIKGSELLARQVNIVQGSGDSELARADSMLWMLTPRRANYNISSSTPSMTISDYYSVAQNDSGGFRKDTSILEPDAGKSFRVEDFNVPMWEEAQFVGQGLVEVGKGVKIVSDAGGLTLRNDTPFDMRGAVLVDNGQIYVCGKDGELKKGSSGKLVSSGATDESGQKLLDRIEKASRTDLLFRPAAGPRPDNTQRQLAQAALTTALGSNFGKQSQDPVFIAWASTPAAPLILEDETPVIQNVSLFVFRLSGPLAAGAR